MKISVKLFAHFTDHLPPGSRNQMAEVEVAEGSTAESVLRGLGVPVEECRLALFNGITHSDPGQWLAFELREGDTLAVLPNIH